MSNGLQQRNLFGRIAVAKGFLTPMQLDTALRVQAQLGADAPPLGTLLIQRFVLTPRQVRDILDTQRDVEQQSADTGIDAMVLVDAAAAGSPTARSSPPAPRPAAASARPAPAPQESTPPPQPYSSTPKASAPAPKAYTPPPAAYTPPPAAYTPPPAAYTPPPKAHAPAPQPYTPPPQASTSRPAPSSAAARQQSARSARLDALLDAAERRGASDLHLHPDTPIALRLEGRLGLLEQQLPNHEQERMMLDALTPEQQARLDEKGQIDLSYVTAGGLRTRANLYKTQAGLDGTFRLLRRGPQSFEALGLPNTLAKLVGYHQGLVLVTGPAGSGKSTTLAALVDLIAEDRAEHVLVLEDPIEIVHPVKKALVNQRQVGLDTESFARALRGALREDPDVIVIGELRDRETISLAITAAETGHLVIGSMQTTSAVRTVARLVDAFPPSQQAQVRAMLSESLRGVVSQRLVPGVDGRRVPAVELLFVNAAIGNLIREGKLFQIKSVLQTGRSSGMCSFDDALKEHVVAGRVSADVARALAETPASIPGGTAAAAPQAANAIASGARPAQPAGTPPAAPSRSPFGFRK